MAENTLQMHAEQIAAHMSQTGELPSTNEVLSQPVNKTPENQPREGPAAPGMSQLCTQRR